MPVQYDGNHARVTPCGPVTGDADLPGSKSLTNRYLICAALADGQSTLAAASLSDDVRAMIAGLRQLGIAIEVQEQQRLVSVTGCRGSLPADEARLDAGHAGTTMRFLTALAAAGYGRFTIDGSARMRQRPIGPLVQALETLGANIDYAADAGFPPLNILARGLRGGAVVFTTPPSSQYISALLMVAPYARQDVMLRIEGDTVSQPYVEMTLDVMRSMGVEAVGHEGRRFIVPALQRYAGGRFTIEPDASAATYFAAAAAITGGRVRIPGLSSRSRQGDVGFVDVLAQMGCSVTDHGNAIEVAGPPPGELVGVDVDLNDMPDTAQTLAVAGLFARGPTTIRNVANLRIKETDRLAALDAELRRVGAQVDLRPDGLTVHPPDALKDVEIDTYDDHRMAMSFALIGLAGPGVTIRDADCVSKSFPGFFEVIARF